MKQLITSIVAAWTVAATVHAGIPNYSLDRPGSESGRGLYLAAQGGVNLYQSTANDTIDGVALTSKSKVGGFGGLKLGYVFGTVLDTVRPAAEIDGFYNGFSQSATADYLGYKIDDIKVKVNSGALMANGLVRFALSSFQPYIGVGVGGYNADESVTVSDVKASVNRTGFAWQLLAGVDCYITDSVSVFTEYKFLNYMDSGDRLGQQLVGAGVRFHF